MPNGHGRKTPDTLVADSTDVSVLVQLENTDGTPATGLTFATSGLKAYTFRVDLGVQQITLVTQTPTGAWSSGGFVELNATTAPGLYRLDIPNARVASGAAAVALSVTGTGLKTTTLVSWLVPRARVYGTVGVSPTKYMIRVSGATLSADQLLRRQVQLLSGAAAHERVAIVECQADGDLVVSPPFTTAPVEGDRLVIL